jgi:DNA-directed RNA polymerase beta' subunit
MKKTLTTACFTALLILGNIANAQATALDNPFAEPKHEAPPATTKMRVDTLKTRHSESLTTLTAALNKITSDPALVTAKETFGAIDKADRDMDRSKIASDSILAALRSEVATIKADSAYSDEQKTELENAARTMADECIAIRNEAEVVIKNLAKGYKVLGQAKKIYKSYLNLQGEIQAQTKLKAAVAEFVKGLTQPTTVAQSTEPAVDKK